MALDIADVQDLIRILRENPALRDAARAELVDEDMRALPLIVRRLADAQDRTDMSIRDLVAAQARTEVQLEQLTTAQARLEGRFEELVAAQTRTEQRLDSVAASLDELTKVVGQINGRLGNVEGWRYEQQFHAQSRVTDILRRPVHVQLGDVDALQDAREDGLLTEADWEQLKSLDFLFRGRIGRGADAPEAFVALEVSRTVDRNDVRRAHERAEILRRAGLTAFSAAGGQQVTAGARELADEHGVVIIVDRSEAA